MTNWRGPRATFVLTVATALLAAAAACSGKTGDVSFDPSGGTGPAGSSATSAGANQAGGGAAAAAGTSGGGKPSTGGSGGAGTVGGTSSGGTASGGDTSGAGASGEAGSGQAGAGGGASTTCAEGCVEICEGNAGCMCSCPTTTLKCPSTAQPNETSFQSSCKVADDCFGAEHYTGCCRVAVVGLNASQRERFAKWEKDTCSSPPICDCAIDTLVTDDGKMIRREMSYAVRCSGGKCASYVP